MKKILIALGVVFIALIPAFLGIFHPGFFLTDDGNWMVIRLSAFYEALRFGEFPVRYLFRLNNGYGYPVSDFLYPLFLYFGSFIHLLHIPFVMTVKLLFALSLLTSAVGSFFWLRRHFSLTASVVGALSYTLFPYHVWDITKRGSLGEVLAMGIVPFIFWQIDTGNIFWTALGIGLLILAHNTLALLFLPVILCYMLLEKKIKLLLLSVLLGVGLSTFFWFPALYDKQFTVFDMTVVSSYSQYFLTSQLYPLIGMISFVVILLSLLVVFKKATDRLVFFLCVTLLSISLTTSVSTILWQVFHLGTYVQFPFRFLSLTALGVGFLCAYSISHWKKNYMPILAGVMLILLYISSSQFFFAKTYQNYPDTFYSTNQDTTTVQNEYMPIWVKKPVIGSHIEWSGYGIEHMGTFIDKGNTIIFSPIVSQQTQFVIGKVFFPGWVVTVDNKPQKIQTNEYGFIGITIPKGHHTIKAWFGETTERLVADVISLISLVGMIGLFLYQKKGNYVERN